MASAKTMSDDTTDMTESERELDKANEGNCNFLLSLIVMLTYECRGCY
jgi:hypothetical protein